MSAGSGRYIVKRTGGNDGSVLAHWRSSSIAHQHNVQHDSSIPYISMVLVSEPISGTSMNFDPCPFSPFLTPFPRGTTPLTALVSYVRRPDPFKFVQHCSHVYSGEAVKYAVNLERGEWASGRLPPLPIVLCIW